jgi:hypothetical protein
VHQYCVLPKAWIGMVAADRSTRGSSVQQMIRSQRSDLSCADNGPLRYSCVDQPGRDVINIMLLSCRVGPIRYKWNGHQAGPAVF